VGERYGYRVVVNDGWSIADFILITEAAAGQSQRAGHPK
jgi:hypothetical protein